MDRKRAIQLLKGGYDSVQRWNRWRNNHIELPNFSYIDFTDTDLAYSNLSSANLEKGNFLRARLVGTVFENGNLTEANFRFANLNYTIFVKAKLIRANFKGANLCGADFRRAIFKDVIFSSAECDVHTRWPDGFDPLSVGLIPWPD